MDCVKSCKIQPVIAKTICPKSKLAFMKRKPPTNKELFVVDNFLHKIRTPNISEWDYSASCSKDYCHPEPNQALEVTYMRGCVTSSYEVAGGGQSLLDAPDRVIDSGQDEGRFDTLENFWDMFRDDSSSASALQAMTASDSSGDEEVISSSCSRQLHEERPSQQSPSSSTIKQTADMDSPPDDMNAFFGHPLTRATNALNGEEADTNADAEALLHEYNHLASMDKDVVKINEKLSGFLNSISCQQSNPLLSTNRSEVNSSLSSENPPSPDTGHIHQDGVGNYKDEVAEVCCQQADDMTAYVNIFLQDDSMQLGDYILDGQPAEQPDHNIDHVTSESSRQADVKKQKSAKRGLGHAVQRRRPTSEVKRATRKSRARSDAVTSTTNGLSGHVNDQAVSDEHTGRVYPQSVQVGVFSGPGHQFEPKGAVVTSADVATVFPGVVTTQAVTSNSVRLTEGNAATTSSSACPVSVTNTITTVVGENYQSNLRLPQLQKPEHSTQVLILDAALTSNSSSGCVRPSSTTTEVISTTPSPASTASVSTINTVPASAPGSVSVTSTNSQNVPYSSLVNENSYLKRVLSEKIRGRQATEESLITMPSQTLNFINDDVPDLALDAKFSPMATIKQEDMYMESFDNQYMYGSQYANTVASLANCSALAMTSSVSGLHNILPVTMTMCEEAMTPNDATNNGLAGMSSSSVHHISNASAEYLSFHQQQRQQHHQLQQQQCHYSHGNSSAVAEDTMIVHSPHGQYFQVLQPLRPIDSHSNITSNCNPTTINNATNNYYNHAYHNSPNTQLLESNKQMVVERYLHQQYTYGNDYTHFLNPENSYSMKSPDSGFHEPCLSPISSSATLKETTTNCGADGPKEKTKKKKSAGGGGLLIRQYSSSSSEKAAPRSPAIQKLDVNNTGYSYFLETPISTTQRRDEDRVTYLNKSQYYGLSLEFNSLERVVKCAVVKSVIILAFRDERTTEEEMKAWEFWHGRQHSYKQRILDIDTKNCQGVLPQNIEELSFNAVAVKWNPMDGPVRVNIAVHCLSTDFSNQKGVKGIPLHIQIDTYEQSLKGNHLVHRGYCQIKAFCDKGAERKTRDEERRKAAKGKPDEFVSVQVSSKSRKKLEEVFHEPCERSEFYSMVNTTTPPVFFNPLYENTEFIHKSLTIGVVTSQDEEISSLPSKLDLPDSCDDYYINSPAKRPRRDSVSSLKDQQKVLLYIRERHETAFTALMLEVPTLNGLLKSIELKYSIAPSKVKNFYKKSKKGILVKLDDNIVRHYSHEATFIIETNMLNENGDYEIILIEIDPVSS